MSQVEINHGLFPAGGSLSLIRSEGGGMAPDMMVSVAGPRVAQSPVIADRAIDDSKFAGFSGGRRQRKDSVFYEDGTCSPLSRSFQMPLRPPACLESPTFQSPTMSSTAMGKTESESEDCPRRTSAGSVSDTDRMNRSGSIGRLASSQKNKKTEQQVAVLRYYFEKDDKPSSQLIQKISHETKLTAKEVRNWFRNRRCRCPKQAKMMYSPFDSLSQDMTPLPDDFDTHVSSQPWRPNLGLANTPNPFVSFTPQLVVDVSNRIQPSSPPLFNNVEQQTMRPYRLEEQLQYCNIMKSRFLMQFERWPRGSRERVEMLNGLVGILGSEELLHALDVIESQLAQHRTLKPHAGMRRSDRAWKELERIFRTHQNGSGHTDDSGQGSDASVSSHGRPDMSSAVSSHGRPDMSSAQPQKKDSTSSVWSTGSRCCSPLLLDDQPNQCNKAMVHGLVNMFKNRRDYLEAMCRDLGYQITSVAVEEEVPSEATPCLPSSMPSGFPAPVTMPSGPWMPTEDQLQSLDMDAIDFSIMQILESAN